MSRMSAISQQRQHFTMEEEDDWDEAVWSAVAALESSHAQHKTAEAQWACRSCTLLNPATSGVCAVCMTPRGLEHNSLQSNGVAAQRPNAMPGQLSQPRKIIQATLPFYKAGEQARRKKSTGNTALEHFDEQTVTTDAEVFRSVEQRDESAQGMPDSSATRNCCAMDSEVKCRHNDTPVARLAGATNLRHKGEDPAAKHRYLGSFEESFERVQYPQIDSVAANTFIYPTNYPVREYQLTIAEKSLYHNTLVSLPTGLGKTLIASVVMYNFYRWFPDGQIVFMAPTKPLVAQQIGACHEIMGIPLQDTAELQGSVPPSIRKVFWDTKRVFFCTPQSMQNDLQRGICRAERLVCVVVDEAHRATGNYAYCNVIQEVEKVTRHFRVLALSATPGAKFDVIQDVIRNLRITHIESRSADDADVKKYTHARQEEVIKCSLTAQISEAKSLLVRVFQRITQRLLAGNIIQHQDPDRLTRWYVLQMRERFRSSPNYQSNRSAESDLALLVSLLHARDLLTGHGLTSFKQWVDAFITEEERNQKRASWSKKELLQSTEFQSLRLSLEHVGTADGFSSSHPKLLKLREVLHEHFQRHSTGFSSTRAIVFTQYRSSVQEIVRLLEPLFPLIKAQQFVGQSASGKSKESKGQTQREQQEIVRKFRAGMFNVLVATCIAEEGLDIGEVDLIVSFDALTSPVRMIQRMGRTGRKRVGRVVILVTEGDEEKKLARSIASAKTVSRALTTFKSKFVYGKCARMIPPGIIPELAALEMEIPEFHPSQVAGKQQATARHSARPEMDKTSERKDEWKLNELEKSIVKTRYTPGDWRSAPRHDFVPLSVSRKILFRNDHGNVCGNSKLKSVALLGLVRSINGIKEIDIEQEEPNGDPVSGRAPLLGELQAVGQADSESLIFSEPDGDDLHYSPLCSAIRLPCDATSPIREGNAHGVQSKLDTKLLRSMPSPADKLGAGTTHVSPLRQTTITGKPSPSPSKRGSVGSRLRKKRDRPRDAVEDSLLERGERLLERLKVLVSSSPEALVAEDGSVPVVDTPSSSENPPIDAFLNFPSIARRLDFGSAEKQHHVLARTKDSNREDCVPSAPLLHEFLQCTIEDRPATPCLAESSDPFIAPGAIPLKSSNEFKNVCGEELGMPGQKRGLCETEERSPQSDSEEKSNSSSYTGSLVNSLVNDSSRLPVDAMTKKSKRSLALRSISVTDDVSYRASLPNTTNRQLETKSSPTSAVEMTSPYQPLTFVETKRIPKVLDPSQTILQEEQPASSWIQPSSGRTLTAEARSEVTSTISQIQPCSICYEHESYDDDLIVFCDGCNVAVHQYCYGVPRLPNGHWYCDSCLSANHDLPAKRNVRACSLCPIRSSSIAMKKTRCGHWVHVQCFMWIPEFEIEFKSGALLLGSIDRIDPDRRSLNCSLCHSKRGFGVIQCAHKRCLAAFHVSCASGASSGGYKLVQVDDTDTRNDHEPETLFLGYCPIHNNSKEVWRPGSVAFPSCDDVQMAEQSPKDCIIGPNSRTSSCSPSDLLASQAESSTKQRKQFRRLKRKYDVLSAPDDTTSPGTRSPWSKRVQRSQKRVDRSRAHAKVIAQMFFEDEVEAPSSSNDDEDEEEEMTEEDEAFIDNSSQLVYSPSIPTPVRQKKSKRNSLGDMRAIYARSMIESPPTPAFLRRGSRMLPSQGIINTCLQELRGDFSQSTTSQQSRLSENEEDGNQDKSVALPCLPRSSEEKDRHSDVSNDDNNKLEEEGNVLREKIEANRLKALQILQEKRLAVQNASRVMKRPHTDSFQPSGDQFEEHSESIELNRDQVQVRPSATTDISHTSIRLAAQRSSELSEATSTKDELEIIVRPDFRESSIFEILEVPSPNGLARLRIRCDSSLEVDALLSLRVAVIFMEMTSSTMNPSEHHTIKMAQSVFKLFLVVINVPSERAVQDLSRSSQVRQLRELSSCRGVIVASDTRVVIKTLVSIVGEEAHLGFAITPRGLFSPPEDVSGVDAHFHNRVKFFRATGLLSLGSVLSLSFRFDKFTVKQIPVGKFSAAHWQRMLPWVTEVTATQLHRYFLRYSA